MSSDTSLPPSELPSGEAFRRDATFIRQLLQSASDCFAVLDLEGRLISISDGARQGWEVDDLTPFLQRPWAEAWHADFHAAAAAAVKQAAAGGVGRFVASAVTGRGATKWWDVSITPLPETGANATRLLGVARDVTAQRLAADRLAESQGRFEAAFRQSLVGMSLIDSAGRVLEINDAFCRMVGRPREELLGRDSSHYTFPDDRAETVRTVDQAIQGGGQTTTIDKRYLHASGATVWARVSLSATQLDAEGKTLRLVGVIEDITESRRAQEAIRSSEAWLRQVFESVHDYAIFTLDLEGVVTSWNTGAQRLFGYAESEIVGQNSAILFSTDDQVAGIPARERRNARDLGYGHEEGWRRRRDGSQFFASGALTTIRDSQGRALGFTKVCRDVTAQRSTEQALELARTRLDSALSAGEVATFVWETDHNRLYGDANFERMFRVKLGADGSAPLESYLNVLHPEDRMRVQKLVEESVATGQDYEAEYRIVQPDETHRWVIARAKVERGDDGGVTRFTGVVLDVTARKRAEEAQQTTLRELERQWRIFNTILSSTADFAYLLDREGRFLYANRRLLELFGRKLEDVVGKNFRELDYEPWHAEMHMREVAQVFETGKRHVSEVPYRGPTGIFGVFEYIFEPVLGLDGEVEVIAGTTHDITESKRAREALEARERHLSFIIEAAQLGTFDWELPVSPGRINWNDRLRGFFWLEDDAVVAGADTIESRVHPADREKVRTALERAIRGDSRYDVEYRIVGPAGQLRWVHASGQSYEGVDGEIKRFSGVVADITPSKLAAEERERLLESERAARAEAERTSRMKDEFLATLSHELRTPLNAILGWAQVLRSETPTAEDLVQGLSTIERNARAQTQIIEDLLDMSRIISGKVRLDIMRIDLVTVLEQAIETVRPAAAARGIRLQPTLDRRVGPISGDPNRLQQVFWNLLSNAIKFTPRNGRVQILLERVNSHLEVSVVDSGEGIAPEFLPHVFDRFRQQDASTTRRHGGLGLGLAIVKQLVELHGGTVAAHSRGMGEGATFRVALPLRVIEPEEVEERRHPQADFAPLAAPEASIRLDGVTVLVVDDEPDARGLVKRLLQDRQARVLTAGRASEALALLRSERPDVLVSDIGMPEEDGYTLIRKVRALDAGSGGLTPAIALTAYARAEDRMKAILAGFQMHVSKPVEAAELLTMVASLAGKT